VSGLPNFGGGKFFLGVKNVIGHRTIKQKKKGSNRFVTEQKYNCPQNVRRLGGGGLTN